MTRLILVSGMPHSGTRLLFDMIASSKSTVHPGNEHLNEVSEFWPLHYCLDHEVAKYSVHEESHLPASLIRLLVNSYVETTRDASDAGRASVLLKVPYYPVVFNDAFREALSEYDWKLALSSRSLASIKNSFRRRNETKKYFTPPELHVYLARLPSDLRRECLRAAEFDLIIDKLCEAYERAKSQCDYSLEVDFESAGAEAIKENLYEALGVEVADEFGYDTDRVRGKSLTLRDKTRIALRRLVKRHWF